MTTTPISVLNLSAEATQHLARGGFSSIEDLDSELDKIREWVQSSPLPAWLKEIFKEVFIAVEKYHKDHPTAPELLASGMTLRDYFAAKAMVALVSRVADGTVLMTDVTSQSYVIADAMLAARQVAK